MNKVQLIGNLTKDVELRKTQTDKIVGSVTIATNKTITDQAGNKNKVATFHNLVIWNKAAEIIAQYAHKGSKLYVEGEISNRSYEAPDGTKRYVTEIIVQEFEFLDAAKQSDDAPAAPRTAAAAPKKPVGESEQSGSEEIVVKNIPF